MLYWVSDDAQLSLQVALNLLKVFEENDVNFIDWILAVVGVYGWWSSVSRIDGSRNTGMWFKARFEFV